MTRSDQDTGVLIFRGLMWGLLFSLPMWAGIYLILWLVLG